MATQFLFRRLSHVVSATGRQPFSNALRSVALLAGLLLTSPSARAQFQQPFVFAVSASGSGPGIAVYTRNDITGILTPVPGSPFPSREPPSELALDFKGRFLFAATSLNKIEMFTVDPNTGALQEVPNSPFASPTTKPEFLSTESSGQFLYVIDSTGSQPGLSAVESFQIDAVNLGLIPTVAGATDLPGLFAGGATHPSGQTFYVFCNYPNSANPNPNEPFFVLFDSSNGTFTIPSILPINSSGAIALAVDSQGQHVAVGTAGQITRQNLQSDGTLGSGNISINVSAGPQFLTFDALGQFLYVTLNNVAPSLAHSYSATTLQELPNSPQGLPSVASWVVDPTAPLIYADQVYQVDPQTGVLNAILPLDPLPPPFFQSTVFSRPPGSQPIVGPTVLLSTMSLSFGSLSLGQTTGAQTLTILSNGGQALSLNSLALTGANPGDFSITTTTCQVPGALPPGQSCSVLVSFTPALAGSRSAALTITDNATPPTESIQLTGTGLAPAPAVTLIPGSLDFGTVAQGTSTPLNVALKNSGNAALHISSVVVGGANANDFSPSSPSCNAAIPANSTCTISVTFTPLAAGLRTATVTLTDDAPDSPQVISVQGNATATPSSAVVVNPSSPDFGATTQGTSTPMNITVTNPGTAALHITNVVLGGANGSEFGFSSPTCSVAIPAGGTCTIVLTFTPVSVGAHVASLTLTDDASGSPQIISIKGSANAAFTPGAAPNSSTTSSVSAGQTAQYLLQLNPGPGFSGTVFLACSGAPLHATCQVPASVTVVNGAQVPFTVSVLTAGSAILPPSILWRFVPPASIRVLLLPGFVLLLLVLTRNRRIFGDALRARLLSWSAVLPAILLCCVIYAAGCGSTTTVTTTPPPIITPTGTSTISITLSAMSPTQQPLQLPPIQLTLTVR